MSQDKRSFLFKLPFEIIKMRLFTTFSFLLFYVILSAQNEEPTVFLNIQYGAQTPVLDIKNRFGGFQLHLSIKIEFCALVILFY